MIDESIKIILSKKESELNFKGLLTFMEHTGIEFRDRTLRGPLGMAAFYCVYLDMIRISPYHEKKLFFIILHEIAHYKRIAKIGKDYVIHMFSIDDYDKFCEHIIYEEIIADRYASFVYYLLNKEIFPKEATQQLDKEIYQKQYHYTIKPLFGIVKNNEETYVKLLESFVE